MGIADWWAFQFKMAKPSYKFGNLEHNSEFKVVKEEK